MCGRLRNGLLTHRKSYEETFGFNFTEADLDYFSWFANSISDYYIDQHAVTVISDHSAAQRAGELIRFLDASIVVVVVALVVVVVVVAVVVAAAVVDGVVVVVAVAPQCSGQTVIFNNSNQNGM